MQNLRELFLSSTSKFSESNFLLSREKNYTYSDFFYLTNQFSNYLLNNDIKQNDIVAIISEKSIFQYISLFAIWNIGAVAVPINENLNSMELDFIISDCCPKKIIVSDKFYEKLEYKNKIRINILGNEDTSIPYVESIDKENLACIVYTSGSTGNPKGVMLTHKNFIYNADSVVRAVPFFKNDIIYSILPYWHSFGLSTEAISPVLSGSQIAFTDNALTFAKDLTFFNPSVVLIVPRVAEMFKSNILKKFKSLGEDTYNKFNFALNESLKITHITPEIDDLEKFNGLKTSVFNNIKAIFGTNFRFFISGGAPIDINLQLFFNAMDIKILQGYGLTETTPVICVDKIESHHFGSCGDIFPWLLENGGDFTFKDDFGLLSKEIEGELLIKGNCVMKGYWNHKDASAKQFFEGWLCTGDMGFYKNNKLFINGRKTNMIVLANGENLYPEYIENHLKILEDINDIMIFGDKLKNIYAIISVHEDISIDLSLHSKIKKEIQKKLEHFPHYQKPKDFILVPPFSHENGTYTATQKIRRNNIVSMYKNEISTLLKSNGEII